MNFGNYKYDYVSSINIFDPISGKRTIPLHDIYRADMIKVIERRNWGKINYASNTFN